ncbi:hypothetical protein P22_3113 [Propionispora sp. 2/2-37]|uniref:prephenate dehydratase n=1 Tax=Propionispora sp. 2/2-37 TaxID=1677858 RepID=UPI0006BB8ED6|nr:prephenate dehydratase [Propionispora sp. 2/2-37]CUH96987.1 hypothetical protein P22_3113 [Propionispora sp. 2/2-37]
MSQCKENVNTLGYLGPRGTYSEDMALKVCDQETVELHPYATIDAIIRAVADNEIDAGIVPIENSIEGSVSITLDVLAHDVDLYIVGEFVQPIRHYLLTNSKTDKVEVVISHPQPLAQCRKYLANHHPYARLEAVESTAKAAAMVAKGTAGRAAIGSLRAGKLHGLKVIDHDIQDCDNNCTRFILIKRQPDNGIDRRIPYKTSVVCKMNGERPGSLCDFLLEFAQRDVNLTKIESRPARTNLGEYIFFFDIEGSMDEEKVKAAVEAIQGKSLWLKNLGSYPSHIVCNAL